MGKHSLLIWLLISLFSFLLCFPSSASTRSFYHICGNESTYTRSSPFYNNLNSLLLRELRSERIHSVHYNTSVGDDPRERAYGLFSCAGYMGLSDCKSCVDDATSQIVERCPYQTNAIIWCDECLVRYSDQNFFDFMEKPVYNISFPQDGSNQEIPYETLASIIPNLIYQVASLPAMMRHETATVNMSSAFGRRSIFVECDPNLPVMDCSNCLSYAFYQMPTHITSANLMFPCCNIRYDNYQYLHDNGTVPTGQEPEPPPNNGSSRIRTDPTNPHRFRSRKGRWIIIIGSIGAACFFVSLASYFIYTSRKKNSKKESDLQEVQLHDLTREVISDELPREYLHEEKPVNSPELPLMRLEVIYVATSNFSDENKLGQGGFGPVYKGILEDGKEIAVKRLLGTSGQGLLELRTEVALIARLQHRNLVRLLGCCLQNDEKLLIYEYMPNKSLDVFLFGSSVGAVLDWERRLNIIHGIARGLLYLHEDSRLRIIHRDLKASNILLDYEMNPKISDFGMARIVVGNQTSDTTNRVVGTYGYMAPEYAMEGLFSVKSDVFSFGVLLLELVSGKRNNGFHLHHQQGQSLLTYAWGLWVEGRGLEVIDQRIGKLLNVVQALKCIHIGLLCVQEEPANHPNMSNVITMLCGDTISLPQPTHPAFSVGRHTIASDAPGSDNRVSSINGLTLSIVSPR